MSGSVGGGRPPVQGELSLSPWDSLLLEVRRAAYRVGWIDYEIERLVGVEREVGERLKAGEYGKGEAEDGEGGQSGAERKVEDRLELAAVRAEIKDWVKESRAERGHLAGVSDKAIRAGLNQRIVSQVQLEQQTITRVLYAGINAAGLSEEQRERALDAMRREIGAVSLERRGGVGGGAGAGLLGEVGDDGIETETGPVVVQGKWGVTGLEVGARRTAGTRDGVEFGGGE